MFVGSLNREASHCSWPHNILIAGASSVLFPPSREGNRAGLGAANALSMWGERTPAPGSHFLYLCIFCSAQCVACRGEERSVGQGALIPLSVAYHGWQEAAGKTVSLQIWFWSLAGDLKRPLKLVRVGRLVLRPGFKPWLCHRLPL